MYSDFYFELNGWIIKMDWKHSGVELTTRELQTSYYMKELRETQKQKILHFFVLFLVKLVYVTVV